MNKGFNEFFEKGREFEEAYEFLLNNDRETILKLLENESLNEFENKEEQKLGKNTDNNNILKSQLTLSSNHKSAQVSHSNSKDVHEKIIHDCNENYFQSEKLSNTIILNDNEINEKCDLRTESVKLSKGKYKSTTKQMKIVIDERDNEGKKTINLKRERTQIKSSNKKKLKHSMSQQRKKKFKIAFESFSKNFEKRKSNMILKRESILNSKMINLLSSSKKNSNQISLTKHSKQNPILNDCSDRMHIITRTSELEILSKDNGNIRILNKNHKGFQNLTIHKESLMIESFILSSKYDQENQIQQINAINKLMPNQVYTKDIIKNNFIISSQLDFTNQIMNFKLKKILFLLKNQGSKIPSINNFNININQSFKI